MISKLRNAYVQRILRRARRRGRAELAKLASDTLRAVVIPPADIGSVGDAAMLNAVRTQLRNRGFRHIGILLAEGWDAIAGFDEYIPADDWFYLERRSALAKIIEKLGGFKHSYLVGADCIDGVYNPGSISRRMQVLQEHAELGGNARILGSSFSLSPNPIAIDALKALDPSIVVCARDPVSRRRIQDATGRDVRQTADLAFFTGEDTDHANSASALAFIRDIRSLGFGVVGLNINFLVELKHPGFCEAHIKLVKELLENDIGILLVPHDSRGEESDADLLMRATMDVPEPLKSRIMLLEEAPPAATRSVLGSLDMVITSRMHAAILAMSASTPAISFVYQNKFEGLYELVSMSEEGLLFDPAELIDYPDKTVGSIMSIIERRQSISKALANNLDRVIGLANANFV